MTMRLSIDWTEQKFMEMNNVNILVLPGSQHILVKSITHTFHEHSTDVNSGKVFISYYTVQRPRNVVGQKGLTTQEYIC